MKCQKCSSQSLCWPPTYLVQDALRSMELLYVCVRTHIHICIYMYVHIYIYTHTYSICGCMYLFILKESLKSPLVFNEGEETVE